MVEVSANEEGTTQSHLPADGESATRSKLPRMPSHAKRTQVTGLYRMPPIPQLGLPKNQDDPSQRVATRSATLKFLRYNRSTLSTLRGRRLHRQQRRFELNCASMMHSAPFSNAILYMVSEAKAATQMLMQVITSSSILALSLPQKKTRRAMEGDPGGGSHSSTSCTRSGPRRYDPGPACPSCSRSRCRGLVGCSGWACS